MILTNALGAKHYYGTVLTTAFGAPRSRQTNGDRAKNCHQVGWFMNQGQPSVSY
jgi:hypothetical protein